MQRELSAEMITAWRGRRGVYFTASAVEEMMSVNGQNMEMGTHQDGGSWGLFGGAHETPHRHYLQTRCLLQLGSYSEDARLL